MTNAAPIKYHAASVGDLRPNPWNPNKMSDFMLEKARASMRQFGFVDPVLVRRVPGIPGFEIVDGEQRWRAAQLEGRATVDVADIGEISEHAAKRLTIVMNETRGEFDRVGLAALVADLLKQDDDQLTSLAREVLPYSDREIDAFVQMSDFDWNASDRVQVATDEHGEPVSFQARPTFKCKATKEQIAVIERAIARMKETGDAMDPGTALERLAADYLAAN